MLATERGRFGLPVIPSIGRLPVAAAARDAVNALMHAAAGGKTACETNNEKKHVEHERPRVPWLRAGEPNATSEPGRLRPIAPGSFGAPGDAAARPRRYRLQRLR
jgi:hypothetical protein